jgi:uncharacterized protein
MLKKTLGSLALATALFACKDPAPQVIAIPSAEVSKPGLMSVTGSATLEVAPDCADLTMTISADGAKPGLATAAVKAKQQALLAALTKLGVDTANIKLSYLTLAPVYAESDRGFTSMLRVATYRAELTVTVTTKSFDQIADIMETGASNGASSMSSQFRRSDLPELKKKVREMALAAAKDKAAQTAKSLGIELGRVISVNENAGGYMWNAQYFPNAITADKMPQEAIHIGGAMQPLTLDITIGFELSRTI